MNSLLLDASPAPDSRRRALLISLSLLGLFAWVLSPLLQILLALNLLLFAPGLLLIRATRLTADEPRLVRWSLALGISLSLIPLLYLWASLVSLPLGVGWWALSGLALLLGVGWLAAGSAPTSGWLGAASPGLLLAFGLVCALTLASRWANIATVALPLWVDSVHHTLLVRIARETGRLPLDLEPVLPISELTYHWGYHVIIAAVGSLSSAELPDLILWSGQWLNLLHAPAAGALALALWRRPVAALVAALVVGLLSIMPAYYLSWGRYTQLTGLLIIPGLAWAWLQALRQPNLRWWLAVALQLAGLSLIHVRVLAFALCLLAALSLAPALHHGWRWVWLAGRAALGAALAGLALSLPWHALLLRKALLPALAAPEGYIADASYSALRPELVFAGHTEWLIPLALAGALAALAQHMRHAAALLIWVGLLLVAANPTLLNQGMLALALLALLAALRAASERRWLGSLSSALLAVVAGGASQIGFAPLYLLSNDAVVIVLFLPIGLLCGAGAVVLCRTVAHRIPTRFWAPAANTSLLALLAVAAWAAYDLRGVVNETTIIAEAGDRRALAWIAANTAPEARFLINASPWIGVTDRGSDGGYWIPALTGRWTSTPPALIAYADPEEVRAAHARAETVIGYRRGELDPIFALIANNQIDYLYFGVRGGPLVREDFQMRPEFRTVYEADGVTILALNR